LRGKVNIKSKDPAAKPYEKKNGARQKRKRPVGNERVK